MTQNDNVIDLYVKLLRKTIGLIAKDSDDFDTDILQFLGVSRGQSYTFIIDSLYLLEDTQLAKHNFNEFGVSGPTKYQNFGEVYLRIYGLLNACYLQQQAIIEIKKNLSLPLNNKELKEIKECPIFDLRNTFAAHTVNRGYGEKKKSYILDRHGLLGGNLKGYSSNSESGYDSKNAKISEEIQKWDFLLTKHLKDVSFFVSDKTKTNHYFDEVTPKYTEIFVRIVKVQNKTASYTDIWGENGFEVNFV